jgi:hypothetical protein
MAVAVVTLAIGERYIGDWKSRCEKGWRAYCQRHHYDLLVIENSLDTTARGAGRSPSWQKCLILDPKVAGSYDQVVWVDADILIHPNAPAITAGVPPEKIGAIDEHIYPSANSRQRIVKSLIEAWRNVDTGIAQNWESFLDPADWHARAGLPRTGRQIIQAGVMVLSPAHHRDLLERVYRDYEDSGSEQMNYEMRPLSYEIQQAGLHHAVDARFNALVGLLLLYQDVILKRPLKGNDEMLAFLKKHYSQNYFLHFAGRSDLMRLVPRFGFA